MDKVGRGGAGGPYGGSVHPTSTDNAIARYDGTAGNLQNSVVTIADTTGNMAGVGTLSCGAITSAADTDATTILGRCRIHSVASDNVYISHYDLSATNNYALRIQASGALWVQAASGQVVKIGVATAVTVECSAAACTVNQPLSVLADTDATTTLGRAVLSSPSADYMYLSHYDRADATYFALRQNAAGQTAINGRNADLLLMENTTIGARVSATRFLTAFGRTVATTALQDLNSDNYTILATDHVVLLKNDGGAANTAILPNEPALGVEYLVKCHNSSTHDVVISTAGSDTIDGAATLTLAQATADGKRLVYDSVSNDWLVF